MGYGDCVNACKFDALHVIDGLATVNYENCTGCTACSKACPRSLIEMVPFGQENMMTVACSSLETGKSTRGMCKVGCIGCKMCTKQDEAFFMSDATLARLDYEKYAPGETAETAMQKCPTGVIVYRGKTAPEPRKAGEKA
jgi:ferredoxin